MNDTRRMDWLERNPDKLICQKIYVTANGQPRFTFRCQIGIPGRQHYSEERATLREALDDAMKEKL